MPFALGALIDRLRDLTDVNVPSPVDQDRLVWDAATSKWIPKASSGGSGDMLSTNNLSDVASVPTARGNLGLGSAATQNTSAFDAAGVAATVQTNLTAEAATRASADTTNASAITSEASTRASADTTLQTNITSEASTRASAITTEAAARVAGDALALQIAQDLSDLHSPSTARGNLGLGTAAVANTGTSSGNVPTLDGSGKIPVALLPAAVVGALEYQGTWNASSNTPTLTSSTGSKGFYYKVATAGTTTLDGIAEWAIGDWVVYNGTTWDKIDNTDLVSSVAGRTGAVVLANTDVSGLGTASTHPVADFLQTANNLSDVTAATARTNLGLGTAATHDVPASGDATATQAALGNDSRLSDARTPTAHHSTHISTGSDVIPIAVAAGASGLLSGADKTKLDNTSGTNTGDQSAFDGGSA